MTTLSARVAATQPPRQRTGGPAGAPARRRSSWGGDVIGAAALLSVTVVVALWVSGSGLQDLAGGTAPALTSLGRLLGLVSADLLLLQCLMMGRLPWAERTWGQDVLARWHRWLGFTSFTAMVAHVVTITLGYAAGDGTGVLHEAWALVTTYPGMLLAAAGTTAIVGVTVTSMRWARRRLRYESWHLLHLYAYLGVGLALPHQIWTGTDFVGSPLARAYWWTLWIAAAAAMLVFRLGVPLYRSHVHRLRVVGLVQERPGVISVHLRGRRLDALRVQAGQFFVLRFLDGAGWSRGNPYSLSAAPTADGLRVTVQAVGDGSSRVARLTPGTRVLFEGPFGRLTADRRDPARPVLLLGCGVGTTPVRALLEEIDAPPGAVTLVERSRSVEEVLFGGELESLARQRGARVEHLIGPRARDGSWLPRNCGHLGEAEALQLLLPRIAEAEVYVCGPPAWAQAAVQAARSAGVPRSRIHEEKFAW